MKRIELINEMINVVNILKNGSGEHLTEREKDLVAILNAKLNDGKTHSVYKVSVAIKGINYIYIGYTGTNVSKRMCSALSKKAGDTGINKLLRKHGINNHNISEYDFNQEVLATYQLEKQALEREKEEIKKACLDNSVIVLNQKGVTGEYKAKYHRK